MLRPSIDPHFCESFSAQELYGRQEGSSSMLKTHFGPSSLSKHGDDAKVSLLWTASLTLSALSWLHINPNRSCIHFNTKELPAEHLTMLCSGPHTFHAEITPSLCSHSFSTVGKSILIRPKVPLAPMSCKCMMTESKDKHLCYFPLVFPHLLTIPSGTLPS